MHEKPCPNCGHCPSCGRSNERPYRVYPYLQPPYYPGWQPWTQPYITYGGGTGVTPNQAIGGTNAHNVAVTHTANWVQ